MMDNLPTEIIPMIFEHLDVGSKRNFILVCKRFLNVIRCDPKSTGKSMKIREDCEYDVDFLNAMLLNWPSLKYLTLGMEYYLHNHKDLKFLENVKFEHRESLESVEVETESGLMTSQFFSKDKEKYFYFEGK